MLDFSSQEQKFIIFLLISFVFGLGFNYYKNRQVLKVEGQWSAEQNKILKSFQDITEHDGLQDTTVSDSERDHALLKDNRRISKTRITGKININLATVEELETLPRIGPAIAKAIIEYRQKQGPFQSIEEIKNVNKIGPKTFEKIKNSIIVN